MGVALAEDRVEDVDVLESDDANDALRAEEKETQAVRVVSADEVEEGVAACNAEVEGEEEVLATADALATLTVGATEPVTETVTHTELLAVVEGCADTVAESVATAETLPHALADTDCDDRELEERAAERLAIERDGAALRLALAERVGEPDADREDADEADAAEERELLTDRLGDNVCDPEEVAVDSRLARDEDESDGVADGMREAELEWDADLVFVTVSGGEMSVVSDRDDDRVRDGVGDSDGLLLPLTEPEEERDAVGDSDEDRVPEADRDDDTHAVEVSEDVMVPLLLVEMVAAPLGDCALLLEGALEADPLSDAERERLPVALSDGQGFFPRPGNASGHGVSFKRRGVGGILRSRPPNPNRQRERRGAM